MYDSSNSSQNLQWFITPVDASSLKLAPPVEEGNIAFYPNPTNNAISLQGAADSTISIYNANGAMLQSQSNISDNETIDVSSLPIGVYYMKIQNKQTKFVRKLIKN